jgi:hypothetical protein
MWKQQLHILLVLALLAIPLFALDMWLLRSRSGGWISLSLRGALIVPYIAFVLLHGIISTIGVRTYASASLGAVHTLSALLAITLLAGGFVGYSRFDRARSHARWEARQLELRELARVIELREWWYEPNAEQPVAIHVRVKSNESGRFAGNLDANDASGQQLYSSHDTAQRQVARGEEFQYDFPLRRWKEGRPESITIALYLFKDGKGSAPEDVAILFEQDPQRETDGHFLYAKLPPPRTD